MRLKGYYGPPEVERGLIEAIMRGERPMGMGRELLIDDEPNKNKGGVSWSMKPSGMLPSGYSGSNMMGYE